MENNRGNLWNKMGWRCRLEYTTILVGEKEKKWSFLAKWGKHEPQLEPVCQFFFFDEKVELGQEESVREKQPYLQLHTRRAGNGPATSHAGVDWQSLGF